MKEKHARYYESFSLFGALVLLKDALLDRKQSSLNRVKDYFRLQESAGLLELHRELNRILLRAAREWQSYDYGDGYHYQSLDAIGVTGLRDTAGRVASMRLDERLAGRSVLEIGCNTGFLSLSIAEIASRVIAFDINPHLIEIARLAAGHLGRDNVELQVSSFEDFAPYEQFDAVLSFANHSTYDGNTRQSIGEFFDKCSATTRPGGLLLFESHPPEHEGDGLEGVCALIGERFRIEERRVLEYGNYADRGRTFIVAGKPES